MQAKGSNADGSGAGSSIRTTSKMTCEGALSPEDDNVAGVCACAGAVAAAAAGAEKSAMSRGVIG